MKTQIYLAWLALFSFIAASAWGQTTNSWSSSASGKWETAGNWSAGAPSSSQAANLITNGTTKTVTLDATSAASGTMTVSNVVISGPAGTTNTVQLAGTTATPFRIRNALTVDANGSVVVTNSTIYVDTSLTVRTNIFNGSVTLTGAATYIATNSTTSIGGTNGSSGKLEVRGSTMLCSNLTIGVATNSVGAVGIVNSQLTTATNLAVTIGRFGRGELTASNSTLRVRGFNIGNGAGGSGTLTLVSSTNILTAPINLGITSSGTGSLWVTDGSVLTNASSTDVGYQGNGFFTMSNSAAYFRFGLNVGSFGRGTATFVGSSVKCDSDFFIGSNPGSTGNVKIVGGQLNANTNFFIVGSSGDAQLTASNCTLKGGITYVGIYANGTLTLLGGAEMTASLTSYVGFVSTGTVWVSGGTCTMLQDAFVGWGTCGRMILSNGTIFANSLFVSPKLPDRGTLTICGGAAQFSTGLIIGDCASNGLGQVNFSGGLLTATNASHDAVLDVRGGTFTMNSGTLIVDKLVMTNTCGRFIRTGGIISVTTMNLDPNLSAVGDGIPNGWKQQYGLDPFDPSIASADLDGDGFTTLQEYLAGTDPTNSRSLFRITSILREGNNLRVTWSTSSGKTNALQAASGATGYSTNGLSDVFIVTNTIGSQTNYLDVGAGTNGAGRFYRVRLVP